MAIFVTEQQFNVLWKKVDKQGKTLESIEKKVASLKSNNKKSSEIITKLEIIEAWIDNIQLIEKGDYN